MAILDIILRDEVGHVAIGNRWYRWLCRRDGHDRRRCTRSWPRAMLRLGCGRPFNHSARLAAGFSEAELAWLETGG